MEIKIEQKTENVEDWTFVFVGGTSAAYTMRVDRNESGLVTRNAIDNTPVEVVLNFRDDITNNLIGGLCFPWPNLLSYGKTKRVATIYATGDSPVEKELARRKEAFEKRLKEREIALNEGLNS